MKLGRVGRLVVGIALVVVAFADRADAHKPSDSYLVLRSDGANLVGRWDIALRDLDYAIGLDADHDGSIRWGEVRAQHAAIARYALGRLVVTRGGAVCVATPTTEQRIVEHSDGNYTVLDFALACPNASPSLAIDYRLFFELDAQHRGLVRVTGADSLIVLKTDLRHAEITLVEPTRGAQLHHAVREGTHHIWEGIDHLLFLLALLLPSVLRRRPDGWEPVPKFSAALVDVLKVVTAFTLAHSMTLTLAALDVVRLPSRLVESAIAASVMVAAANNLIATSERGTRRRWAVAFALGLLHGFGLSATLTDLGLAGARLLVTLVGFNLGVELGQAVVVACFVPIAFLLRRTRAYRVVALQAGSIVIIALALVWLIERAFAVRIIS